MPGLFGSGKAMSSPARSAINDASGSIQAENSLEKMMAHQLAAVHRVVMDHMAFVPSQYDMAGQAKRLNAAARCMSVYQQELVTMRKLRQGDISASLCSMSM